jgi:Protein of unknown function (DUF2510)
MLSDIRYAKLRFRHMGGQPLPPPGWYPDPSGAPQQRYFDGHARAEHYAPVAAPQRMSDAERAAGSPPRAASAGEPGSAGARMITSPQRRLYSLNQITVAALLGSPFPGFWLTSRNLNALGRQGKVSEVPGVGCWPHRGQCSARAHPPGGTSGSCRFLCFVPLSCFRHAVAIQRMVRS